MSVAQNQAYCLGQIILSQTQLKLTIKELHYLSAYCRNQKINPQMLIYLGLTGQKHSCIAEANMHVCGCVQRDTCTMQAECEPGGIR